MRGFRGDSFLKGGISLAARAFSLDFREQCVGRRVAVPGGLEFEEKFEAQRAEGAIRRRAGAAARLAEQVE